jgi:hypothetical protein
MKCVRVSVVGAVLAVGLLASSAGAAVGITHFEAGHKSWAQYLYFSVSHGRVTTARWSIKETCDGIPGTSINSGVEVLNARVKNGHFKKSVTRTEGGSPVAVSTDTTVFKGTITANRATVTVTDNFFPASYSPCSGSRRFKATVTPRFH